MVNDSDYEILNMYLFKPCAERLSGTSIMTTNNKRSCQIVVNEGVVLSASMGRSKGFDVISELKQEGVKAGSFNENIQVPFTKEASIVSSDDVLIVLGAGRSSTAKAQQLDVVTSEEVTDDRAEMASENKEEPVKKKPVRMYRGNPIED